MTRMLDAFVDMDKEIYSVHEKMLKSQAKVYDFVKKGTLMDFVNAYKGMLSYELNAHLRGDKKIRIYTRNT